MSELFLDPEAVARFRRNYLSAFGAATRDDALYEAISEGRRYAGAEHWLPLFYDEMATLFDYVPGIPVVMDHQSEDAVAARRVQIDDHYGARKRSMAERSGADGAPYKPSRTPTFFTLPRRAGQNPQRVRCREIVAVRGRRGYRLPRHQSWRQTGDEASSRSGRAKTSMCSRRSQTTQPISAPQDGACSSPPGPTERGSALPTVLKDHGLERTATVETWGEVEALASGATALAVMAIEAGFVTDDLAVISEQRCAGRPAGQTPQVEAEGCERPHRSICAL